MGIYMYSKEMLVQLIASMLDDIEGDFTQESLKEALEICKEYPYVCDKEINDGSWRKKFK